jgi:hypothetical protein
LLLIGLTTCIICCCCMKKRARAIAQGVRIGRTRGIYHPVHGGSESTAHSGRHSHQMSQA